uniref:SRPBCC family protein n=1 Tax=Pedobacter schmidteae TaxID=2201271 RepID=UPI000EB4FA61|nr:SRPBCC family protein [Pedobacter schmidteae]
MKEAYVEVQMLIRKPSSEVFEAFIDPEITKNFWFSKGSGKLEVHKTITWEWEMYNVSSKVFVKEIIPNQKISIDWGEPSTEVVFTFHTVTEATTYVVIRQSGLHSTGEALLAEIRDSTGGFTTVVDGLKAYLEHGLRLNLIADKFVKI